MNDLPTLTPRDVITALQRGGFDVVVRVRGSHYQLFNSDFKRPVTVPHHSRDLSKATLASIIRQSGLTREEFRELL